MDAPLVPKKSLLTKPVIIGISLFCFFVVLIIGVAIISNATTPKQQDVKSNVFMDNLPTNVTAAYTIPCTKDGTPAGCDKTRVRTVVCGTNNANGYPTITVDDKTPCNNAKVSLDQYLNMQFYKIPNTNNCYEITAQVGECWGKKPINGGSYTCQGQCGAGCVKGCGLLNGGGPWARSCFNHDICSWYFGASGGANDANCGTSYNLAYSDFFKCECNTVTKTC